MESLFHKNSPEDRSPTPYELIEPEIVHLQKGYSIRHGPKAKNKPPYWVVFIAFCGLAWLYLMDPVMHAWYKGDAVEDYLYLHNYSNGPMAEKLAGCGILNSDEINILNHRQGAFQDYYTSPHEAEQQAETIIAYLADVKLLHDGKYEPLDPVGRMRYALFIYTGLILPTQWDFLDPTVKEDEQPDTAPTPSN